MPKIKICGLKRREDIECVNRLLPDYIGFNFYPQSKRYVTLMQAMELKQLLRPEIKAVGVFVNSDICEIAALASAGVIDMAQLHGDEDEEFCRQLRRLLPLPLIKAVRVRDRESLLGLERYPVDYFLFDTYADNAYGGTGKLMSVDLTRERLPKPYFLAGGLTPENIGEIVARTNAYAVDVCGGVEEQGVKSAAKMQAFVENVRRENK